MLLQMICVSSLYIPSFLEVKVKTREALYPLPDINGKIHFFNSINHKNLSLLENDIMGRGLIRLVTKNDKKRVG